MMQTTVSQVQPLKSYSTHYGFDPDYHVDQKKTLTLDEARGYHERGEQYVLLFGDPKAPDYYIQMYHSIDPRIEPGLRVSFLDGKEIFLQYSCSTGSKAAICAYGGLLVREFVDHRIQNDAGQIAKFWISDALTGHEGLPTLLFGLQERHSISVPWQDFLIGDYPEFDELVDGAFIKRLPRIDLPPVDLIVPHIAQIDRSPNDPRPVPKGRFPW